PDAGARDPGHATRVTRCRSRAGRQRPTNSSATYVMPLPACTTPTPIWLNAPDNRLALCAGDAWNDDSTTSTFGPEPTFSPMACHPGVMPLARSEWKIDPDAAIAPAWLWALAMASPACVSGGSPLAAR